MAKALNYTEKKCASVVKSIEKVIETDDMEKLTKPAYEFIIQKLGFIAHYSHEGFKDHYSQLGTKDFAMKLVTGEAGIPGYNDVFAERFLSGQFDNLYTEQESKNIGNTMKTILQTVRSSQGFNF